jgi:hypothetical protein
VPTSQIIGTLNFISEWQREFPPPRNPLGARGPRAHHVISRFMPRGKESFNIEAVLAYRTTLNISTGIAEVPFRQDWNRADLDDVMAIAADKESSAEAEFRDYWGDILNGTMFETEHIRQRYPPKEGILMIKEIVATYLTLYEFQGVSSYAVLRHCNLDHAQS